ncbi:PTS sugar transporter subunit IIA [Listeria sp. PSOL-1]|uniref:PTS sugar transporter subunit IIA n=1 Tax=Listeria sp. PSOL-1 TaxID=1844999 RepID=UPI0013D156C4|nr:PTS sugar transporter subunit IIA [Listeria sp. PSOL-1]
MIELKNEDIRLNQDFKTKEEAIRAAGSLLFERGYVEEAYIEAMIERDKLTSTFIGNMVAIPHGTNESKETIKNSGIVLLQVPNGVSFDGNETKIIIGIAGVEKKHLNLLSNIALVCSEKENVQGLIQATNENTIIDYFIGSEVV